MFNLIVFSSYFCHYKDKVELIFKDKDFFVLKHRFVLFKAATEEQKALNWDKSIPETLRGMFEEGEGDEKVRL